MIKLTFKRVILVTVLIVCITTAGAVVHTLRDKSATLDNDPLAFRLSRELPQMLISRDAASELVLSEVLTESDNLLVLEVKDKPISFKFPDRVSEAAREYLKEAYNQALEASEHTIFSDPFMAMSLAVVEKPVHNPEVFRIPLVTQDVLSNVLKNGGDYSDVIPLSSRSSQSYGQYECVGPMQIAVGWVSCEKRNPTIWYDAVRMFYEDAELAVPGITSFAEKCAIEVDDKFIRTVAAMRHNVGNLSDWERHNPDSSPNRSFIPFKTKRAVYAWNKAVSSEPAQKLIKQAAYDAYLDYLETGRYENQGIGWREVAQVTGYSQSNVISDREWWRPLYSVRFWYNYYQLQLLYGVETKASLGI